MLRATTPQEEKERKDTVAMLRRGKMRDRIKAILMDTKIGGFGMHGEYADDKANAIVNMLMRMLNARRMYNLKDEERFDRYDMCRDSVMARIQEDLHLMGVVKGSPYKGRKKKDADDERPISMLAHRSQ